MEKKGRASKTPAGKPRRTTARRRSAPPPEGGVQDVAPETPEPASPSFPVVCIGASAGGLEAFSTLLRKLPGTLDLAVVIVQHLARGHQSLLTELLKQATALTVVQARNGLRIEPRHVYVIPPDASMTVTDGHLAVAARSPSATDAPIDQFLRSLAEHYREKAIGIILSGGAHDGALGIRDVKASGGLTIAQDPNEASIDSMPRAAIATGAVDMVLPVGKIADELIRLAAHPFLVADGEPPEPSDANGADLMRRLFQLLRRTSGVDFTHYKSPTLLRRIQRRMAIHRVSTLESYLAVVQETPAEVDNLYEDILIHVTGFFREPESFEVLKEQFFPAILKAHTGENPIRLWVPGCSSGEEVYSLAMALHEMLGDKSESVPVQIFGTDVSQKMIDRARFGVYPEAVAADLTPERLRRFFVKQDGTYRISKAIRERCVFARQDITRDPPFSKLHMVVCRNLLIYLGQPLQRKVIEVFHYALRPTGYLMLGRSETTGSQSELFSLADKRFKIYRKKPGAVVRDLDFTGPVVVEPLPAAPRGWRPAVPPEPPRPDWDVQGEANRVILDRYGPAGVIVDGNLRIVRTRGRTSPYLELPTGDASLDLLKMARQGLLFGLRNAIEECRTRQQPVRKEGLRLVNDGHVRAVNVDVTPMGNGSARHFLVLFEDADKDPSDGQGDQTRKSGDAAKGARGKQRRSGREPIIQQLEEELEASRQYLQSIIHDLEAANEELQSANEEILSSNEELQSTNEELDTAKEELQSTNEELSTLNEELHGRNDELSRVNSDLLNLLASVHIPIVIVTSDLKIRRFTPAAERLLNLIPADVGRPIGHIKPNIHCPDIEALITEVIDSVTIREREVHDHDGARYTLRVRPYKNVENRIDGAVLTLFDLTTALSHAAETRVAREVIEALAAGLRDPVLLLNAELRVQQVNAAFLEQFAVTRADIEERPLLDLPGWDVPAIRAALTETPARKTIAGLAVDLEVPKVGRRRVLLDGRRIESASGEVLTVLTVRSPSP